jgi:hypothetical protein
VNQVRAAAVPQVNQVPVIQRRQAVAPPAWGNDAATAYEIPAVHGPVIEHAGNHAVRGIQATAAIEGGENLATVARNPQPVSGVPEEAQGRRGRYSKNLKGTIQAKACHISFYPPLWTQLLETAKAEMWHALFRQHPFLPDK